MAESDALKRRILDEWIEAIPAIPATQVAFHSRVPQRLLDAVCRNTQISGLFIKWTSARTVQSVSNLVVLEELRLGGASQISDLSPIATLSKLRVLFLENALHVEDYSCLRALRCLRHLSIEGSMYSQSPIRDLSFISALSDLRSFHLVAMRCKDKSIEALTTLKFLEDLSLCFDLTPSERELLKVSLPQLKWGVEFYEKRRADNLARLNA
jgi:hypothetical protein